MIILVSDLHLADSPERKTIELASLLGHLTNIVDHAEKRKVRKLTIVLLGDIFELLKSRLWLEREVRPWEVCTPSHIDAVTEIFRRIVSANKSFFNELSGLTQKYSFVKLLYIPGNHDRPLNTEMGKAAREILRSLLPLPGTGEQEFPEDLLDEEHKLIAHHGHEWDPENRYSRDYVALGDAVVIEVVLQWPIFVQEKLQVPEGDSRFDFLYEIDNVRPHIPEVLWQWVDDSRARLTNEHRDIDWAIRESLNEVRDRLASLTQKVSFESYATAKRRLDFLIWALKKIHQIADYKHTVRLLPVSEIDPYPKLALHQLKSMREMGKDIRYVVCGHTHNPSVVPLDTGRPASSPVQMYLNTGTWRRVRRLANSNELDNQPASFSCWDEECVVSIYNEEDQGLGYAPYEFYRLTRGANT
jgi:UDP-2,3-diacylglucosamine pyrophosphatase LpxH